MDSAETYKLLSQYTANIDSEGNPPTLLVYEELDGVSLADLKKQLESVHVSLRYNEQQATDSATTTHERVQRYFVSVVRKTFGPQLPYHFSRDGRSMIRDAGFVFAVDMFLFNVGRFPVGLPFEGQANAECLFMSTDEDGDSALYGLQNRFMGGHDVIEMPYFLLNGGSMTKHNLKALQQRQEAYTQDYIGKLQKFLSVLSDYYQKVISPNISIMNDHSPSRLLHGVPRHSKKAHSQNRFANISHDDIVSKCLRPLANFIYIHCGFELIIIDEMNQVLGDDEQNEQEMLRSLEVYRNKLVDNMITLLCEGILIGISEIAASLQMEDIGEIIKDIRSLDENIFGIELLSPHYLKLVLRLFHSTSVNFQLNIEDSSSEDEDEIEHITNGMDLPITPMGHAMGPSGSADMDFL